MGWTFSQSWPKPSDVREHLRDSLVRGKDGRRIVADAMTGYARRWWAVVEEPSGERWIFLALIERGGAAHGCGHKDMDESMGPNEEDCPLRFLDMASPPSDPNGNGWASGWRERVRAFHAKAGQTFGPGQRVTIYGRPYTIVRPYKRSYVVEREDGAVFKASPAKMVAV